MAIKWSVGIQRLKSGLLLFLLALLWPAIILAEEAFPLTKVSEFVSSNGHQGQWLAPIENPSIRRQYFLASTLGKIYLLDGDTVLSAPIIDLSNTLRAGETRLTAFALSTDFAVPGRAGFNTFYTAHTEAFVKGNAKAFIEAKGKKLKRAYDSVVTKWLLAASRENKFVVVRQDEILRIALPSNEIKITQLTFNPYIKHWQEDHNFLHIALTGSEEFSSFPLYSGVLLRIDPGKADDNNYAIPDTNPFMNNADINAEVYLLGAQAISQILWSEKYQGKPLLLHKYNDYRRLSLAEKGSDWRNEAQDGLLLQTDGKTLPETLTLYQGLAYRQLRNKLLFIEQTAEAWQLKSLPLGNKYVEAINVEAAWPLDNENLLAASKLSIHTATSDEIFLFNHDFNMLLAMLAPQNNAIVEKKTRLYELSLLELTKKIANQFSLARLLLMLAVMMILILLKIHYWPKKTSAKELLKGKFTAIELNEENQALSLYRYHNRKVDTTLSLDNIVRSEVYLNNIEINIISSELGHEFNKIQESDLLNSLAKERHQKMQPQDIRQIGLRLIDNLNNFSSSKSCIIPQLQYQFVTLSNKA